jgi:hypothetical protein
MDRTKGPRMSSERGRLGLSWLVWTMVAVAPPALSQELPPPCPVVTKSGQLWASCTGPLRIEADEVSFNLRGNSVVCPNVDSNEPGIVISGRHGVSIRNGSVTCGYALIVEGGGSHRFSGLKLGSGSVENARAIWMSSSNENQYSEVQANGGGDGRALLATDSHRNSFKNSTFSCSEFSAAVVTGNGNKFVRNTFSTAAAGSAVYVEGNETLLESNVVRGSVDTGIAILGSRGTFRRNVVEGAVTGLAVDGDGHLLERNTLSNMETGLIVSGTEHQVRSNTCQGNWSTDIVYVAPDCSLSRWQSNRFGTDSEGDGPRTGCIR